MAEFRRNFKKIVYGFASVSADTTEQAESLFEDGDFDEFDNRSEHEWQSEVFEHELITSLRIIGGKNG